MKKHYSFTDNFNVSFCSIMLVMLGMFALASCSTQKWSYPEGTNELPYPEVIQEGFVYSEASFPQCHASTIVSLKDNVLMTAWFGGTHEGHEDVAIYGSRYRDGKWSEIQLLADGAQNDTIRYPCWNPVLFLHSSGRLYLFYKVGPNPRDWWGMVKTSEDQGRTWSKGQRLPNGILGPIRAKPIELANGNLLCPSSEEFDSGKWQVHMETYDPVNNSWTKVAVDHESGYDVIQPTVLRHSENQLQILCRSKQNKVVTAHSEDDGVTWGKLKPINVPNPSAGIDGLTIRPDLHLLIYNPTENGPGDRAKLSLATSSDGLKWHELKKIENEETGEFSYPALIINSEGNLHLTYTWNRRKIKHMEIALNPQILLH